jgi:hypothetical protein
MEATLHRFGAAHYYAARPAIDRTDANCATARTSRPAYLAPTSVPLPQNVHPSSVEMAKKRPWFLTAGAQIRRHKGRGLLIGARGSREKLPYLGNQSPSERCAGYRKSAARLLAPRRFEWIGRSGLMGAMHPKPAALTAAGVRRELGMHGPWPLAPTPGLRRPVSAD